MLTGNVARTVVRAVAVVVGFGLLLTVTILARLSFSGDIGPADTDFAGSPGIDTPATPDRGSGVSVPEASEFPTIVVSESASLAEMRRQDLLPFQWPWFAEDVPVPADAVSAAADLQAAIATVPELAGFKVMSAQERYLRDDDGLLDGSQFRWVWLKVSDDQMMSIDTHLIEDATLLAELEPGVREGTALIDGRSVTGVIEVRQVIGARLVAVSIQSIVGDEDLLFTGEDLTRFGRLIVESMEG